VFTRVIAAGDVGERILRMGVRCLCQNSARWIVPWKRSSDIPHAPGTTEIQTIEMDQFRIAAVRDSCRHKQGARLIFAERRQKAMNQALN